VIDFRRLAAQLDGFAAYRRDEDVRHAARLERALAALGDVGADWPALAEHAERESGGPLRAVPRADPAETTSAPHRPATVTVVATDGSQIFPDRHVEPTCYLLNIGRVALHLGTLDRPLIVAEPSLHYREEDLADLASGDDPLAVDFSAEVVSALRDELELRWLFDTAHAERHGNRPIVAMADGTLIRWMLRGMKNRRLEDRLIGRYVAELDRFLEAQIPVLSYVSAPANAEVVNLLRLHLGDPGWEGDGPDSLAGVQDRHLFERALAVGERSSVFASRSQVLHAYGPHRVEAFYLRLPQEVGRVEVPAWVAARPDWLDLIHAVVLDQAQKGGGYPVILQEAHQRAVVRREEAEIFHRLIARRVRSAGGSVPTYSGKAASKRLPRI
jgi:hypothetical protein